MVEVMYKVVLNVVGFDYDEGDFGICYCDGGRERV